MPEFQLQNIATDRVKQSLVVIELVSGDSPSNWHASPSRVFRVWKKIELTELTAKLNQGWPDRVWPPQGIVKETFEMGGE